MSGTLPLASTRKMSVEREYAMYSSALFPRPGLSAGCWRTWWPGPRRARGGLRPRPRRRHWRSGCWSVVTRTSSSPTIRVDPGSLARSCGATPGVARPRRGLRGRPRLLEGRRCGCQVGVRRHRDPARGGGAGDSGWRPVRSAIAPWLFRDCALTRILASPSSGSDACGSPSQLLASTRIMASACLRVRARTRVRLRTCQCAPVRAHGRARPPGRVLGWWNAWGSKGL